MAKQFLYYLHLESGLHAFVIAPDMGDACIKVRDMLGLSDIITIDKGQFLGEVNAITLD